MCLGDSLTLGAGAGVQGGGYRLFLKQACVARSFDIDFVGSSSAFAGTLTDREHDGHGGWTTADLVVGRAEGSAEQWVKTFRPDVVLLMVGRNDSNPLDIQAVDATFNLLLNSIFEGHSSTKVFFSNVLYSRSPDSFDLQKCAIADAAIQQCVFVARLAGQDVVYVDAMRVIGTNPAYYSDNVHLSDLGYQRLSAVWFSRLYHKPVHLGGGGTRRYP